MSFYTLFVFSWGVNTSSECKSGFLRRAPQNRARVPDPKLDPEGQGPVPGRGWLAGIREAEAGWSPPSAELPIPPPP